ncbi:MAG: hypothetical protein ACI4FY_08375 [Acetatifactor sp.]
MSYAAQLDFVCDLLNEFHIPNQIITDPEVCIPVSIDRGLRAALYCVENYNDILQNSMSDAKDHTIYRFFDEYYCRYIFLKLPGCEHDSYFFVGPYLSESPNAKQIQKTADSLFL